MARLTALAALALASGAAGYSVGRPPAAAARRRPHVSPASALSLSSAAMPAPGGQPRRNQNNYRVLGITEDATYDEITEAFSALVAQAGEDEARIAQLERARDLILDQRLKQRLSGATPAPKDPLVKPKEKRDWLAPLKALGKYVEVPGVNHAVKMSCIFLGFAVASLVAPGVSDQMAFFSFIFAPAFIYQRGTPEPVRDDFGQVRAQRTRGRAGRGAGGRGWRGARTPRSHAPLPRAPWHVPACVRAPCVLPGRRWERSCRPSRCPRCWPG